MLQHRAVSALHNILEIALCLAVHRALGAETGIAGLPGDLAKLRTGGKRRRIIEITGESQTAVKSLQKAFDAGKLDMRFGDEHDARRGEIGRTLG